MSVITKTDKPCKTPEDWARIWFRRLTQFHNINDPQRWQFTRDDVIAFLRHNLKAGVPAWKRLKIVEGLILYRRRIAKSELPELYPMRSKLRQIASQEQLRRSERSIEEVVGKINPKEPDAVQEFRRKLRVMGRQYNTEKAYVKWLRRFRQVRGLRCLADFESATERDVESFLTDLAVDGGVAASTQEQAFFALLFFFEHVLKREFRNINAMRSDRRKLVPTVMSEPEVAAVFENMTGVYQLMAQLLYGSGMRIGECLRLRVMDIDFDQKRMPISVYERRCLFVV